MTHWIVLPLVLPAMVAGLIVLVMRYHPVLQRVFSLGSAMGMLAISPSLLAWKLGWKPAFMAPVVKVVAEPRLWLVVLPGYWVARNLPWFPFTLLAPG